VCAVAALALTAGYVVRSRADARAWDRAAAEQRLLLGDLHAALPRPPAAAALYAVGATGVVGPGIPVLGTTLDLTSAARLSYASSALVAVPLTSAAELRCGPRGPTAGAVQGAYARSYVIDLRRRRALRTGDRARCAAAVRELDQPVRPALALASVPARRRPGA
jgi:hypothetical protein